MTQIDFSAPFEALAPGARFRSRGRTITEADVVGFAALTGDWHPQHSDREWAAQSAFGERIAHGMLIVSFAVGLVPFDPSRVVALRGISDVVFKRPVRFGDTIHVAGEVAAVRPVGDEAGLVTWSWQIRNQNDELVCRAKVDVLWSRDAGPTVLVEEPQPGFVAIPL
jgi:3-hydroxybutyryl-CoA dehydratase